jgi:hypothetical protein
LASGARRRACAPCMSIPLSEIPWLDLPDTLSIGSATVDNVPTPPATGHNLH